MLSPKVTEVRRGSAHTPGTVTLGHHGRIYVIAQGVAR